MPEPALSVVIIGRNEGLRLVRCIQSVQAMDHPFGELEVIYVDSCSTDCSPARAAELGAIVVSIKTGKLCAARARNAGWQIASAPFILFLDGDTILEPGFVVRAMEEINKPDYMIVYGNRREINTDGSIYNRVMDIDWIEPPGLKDSCGGDALFRRSCLEQTGGFNPELIGGEEPELCRRVHAIGGLISRIDILMTSHDLGILTWRQYWKRALRTGYAYAEVSAIYKSAPYPFWLAESRKNLINGSLYSLGFLAAVALSVVLHSWLVLALFLAGVAFRILRTVYKFRAKSPSRLMLILWGVHSHLQQIPILVGQIKCWANTRRDWRSELVGYKT